MVEIMFTKYFDIEVWRWIAMALCIYAQVLIQQFSKYMLRRQEMEKRIIKLQEKKVCNCCGKIHTHIPVDAKSNEMGHFWNCSCDSTLFKRCPNYQPQRVLPGKPS